MKGNNKKGGVPIPPKKKKHGRAKRPCKLISYCDILRHSVELFGKPRLLVSRSILL